MTSKPARSGGGTAPVREALAPIFDRVLAPLVADCIERRGTTAVEGSAGSLSSLVAAAAAERAGGRGCVLHVVAHLDEADDAVEELRSLGIDAAPFPAIEVLPGETSPSADLTVARLAVVRRLGEGAPPPVIVAPIAALMQAVPSASRMSSLVRDLATGARVAPTELVTWLVEGGYRRVDAVESPGEVAVRGGIVDICPPGGAAPIRLDFFGDEIERMFEIDLATQASDRRIDRVELVAVALDAVLGDARTGAGTQAFAECLPPSTVVVLAEMAEIIEQARAYWDRVRDSRGVFGPPATLSGLAQRAQATIEMHAFGSAGGDARRLGARVVPPFHEDAVIAAGEVSALAPESGADGIAVVVCESDGERARMTELLARHAAVGAVALPIGHLARGFVLERGSTRMLVVPASEVLHRAPVRRRGRTLAGARAKDAFLTFEPGDYVVHRDHGIARFVGLQLIKPDGAAATDPAQEFLTLEFDQGAKIHVPATRIELVQRYVGAGSARQRASIRPSWKKVSTGGVQGRGQPTSKKGASPGQTSPCAASGHVCARAQYEWLWSVRSARAKACAVASRCCVRAAGWIAPTARRRGADSGSRSPALCARAADRGTHAANPCGARVEPFAPGVARWQPQAVAAGLQSSDASRPQPRQPAPWPRSPPSAAS